MNKLGFWTWGIAGATLVAVGFFKYSGKLMQISVANRYSSLEELKRDVKEHFTKYPDAIEGVYCKVEGYLEADGEPYIAPVIPLKLLTCKISRKKVAIYKYKRFAEPVEHREMDLIVTNGKVKIEVDKKGAVIFLQTAKRSLKESEYVLQVGKPVFIVGEVFYEKHGDRLIIRKPYYGKAFLISAHSEASTLFWMSVHGKSFIITGSILLLGSVWFGAHVVFEKSSHLFSPIL